MLGPEVWILANQDGWVIKTVHYVYCWQPRLFWMELYAFWAVQCPSHLSEANAKLSRGAKSDILPHLPWQHSCPHTLLKTSSPTKHCFWPIQRAQSETEAIKVQFFKEEITYLSHWVSKDGMQPSNLNLKVNAECTPPQTYTEVHAFLGLVAHILHSHSMNTWLEKEPAGSQSGCHFHRMPWRLLKCWNRHVWQLLCWLLPTIPNHFCWRLMCWRTD